MSLCETCHVRPKYVENGKEHPYCGRTCASKAKRQGPPPAPGTQLCETCHVRPRYVENGIPHPYCGRTCASKAKEQVVPNALGTQLCENCHAHPKCVENGKQHPYCGRTCAQNAKGLGTTYLPGSQLCEVCHARPKYNEIGKEYPDCSRTCASKAPKGSSLTELAAGDPKFQDVSNQFYLSWRHADKPRPTISSVYKITLSSALLKDYEDYRNAIEAVGHFEGKNGMTRGNENRRWHGTSRACRLGDNGQTRLCASPSCALCGIVTHSLDIARFKEKTGWGRFGKGIYTSSTSSKANDYCENKGAASESKLRAVLLTRVVVGRGCRKMKNDETRTRAPDGFDSVLGEVGNVLNHDELVVYTNRAIRPAYLVIYG